MSKSLCSFSRFQPTKWSITSKSDNCVFILRKRPNHNTLTIKYLTKKTSAKNIYNNIKGYNNKKAPRIARGYGCVTISMETFIQRSDAPRLALYIRLNTECETLLTIFA